ncbi:SH3 domain-containing protein [Capilliphycus salinus ALCB114379]|uniref:SH3 domain-containing protein n=1 Tax=Capilliphycus salinus TaxID=2768948 RepID=UPI0039A5D21A
MSFKPSQLVIAGAAGLASAVIVAYITVSTPSSQAPSSDTSNSTTPAENTPSPLAAAPANAPPSPPSGETNPMVIRPPVENCRINMAVVDDPEPPLNVRSSPEVKEGNIVGQLDNNTFISVVKEDQGWLQISSPVEGWVAKNRTKSSCANVNQAINFFPGGNSAIIKGEIIGGGSHRYTLNAQAGQTLTVESREQVFPRIVTPDGQLLAGDPYTDDRTEWTGELPQTGEYSLELDSNFRGYEYEFLVKVQ